MHRLHPSFDRLFHIEAAIDQGTHDGLLAAAAAAGDRRTSTHFDAPDRVSVWAQTHSSVLGRRSFEASRAGMLSPHV